MDEVIPSHLQEVEDAEGKALLDEIASASGISHQLRKDLALHSILCHCQFIGATSVLSEKGSIGCLFHRGTT